MKFELDESQLKRLRKWQKAIKKEHGDYGSFEYRFTPTGIGCLVEIYSNKTKSILDLSDVAKW